MQDLVLLHGAMGAKDQLEELAKLLSPAYRIHLINFAGHGGKAFDAVPFSIPEFAESILEYLKEKEIRSANFFGYSMGGYVAMYIARTNPSFINKIVTLATKFHWDEAVAAREVKMLDAATIQQKVPAFALQLEKRHGSENWIRLLDETKHLLQQLGMNNILSIEDYKNINTPTLLLLGDRDRMVSLEESVNVYTQLRAAQLGILPGTPHPLEQVDKEMLAYHIRHFLG